jgi:hypothetical protein
MAASERIRKHLEASTCDMTSDLENSDCSKQSLQQHRNHFNQENARLAELLAEEAETRLATQAARVKALVGTLNFLHSSAHGL